MEAGGGNGAGRRAACYTLWVFLGGHSAAKVAEQETARSLGKNGAEKSQIREPGNQGVVVEVT